ncbi:hypothetical protein HH219_16580 [Pseudoalteromonas sp. NEC-BIFX-2020_015]|uniref:hypothetical protein n=1 Tax=Pseudoalteromonas sp. NEC-BIFX-2020_015 TaxID=2729544 RepID=UPI00146159A6|nr:hypothetical protein [Pseudoalteromonas sp. NEC-BIFX-2020_015]NMR27128.1 hypothetical protein [Pseudoalteromonas sp. NEC-BIFX-2020_015]
MFDGKSCEIDQVVYAWLLMHPSSPFVSFKRPERLVSLDIKSELSRFWLTAYRLPLTAYRLPLTAYRLPLTAYRLPLTAYCLLLTAYRLLLTAYRD